MGKKQVKFSDEFHSEEERKTSERESGGVLNILECCGRFQKH